MLKFFFNYQINILWKMKALAIFLLVVVSASGASLDGNEALLEEQLKALEDLEERVRITYELRT